MTVSARVTNTGSARAGEVVQLYVRDLAASVPVPQRHLEGAARVELGPGESRLVTFCLGPEALCCYGDDGEPRVEPGEFEICVGGRQPDVCLDLPACGNLLRARLTVA